MVCIPCIVIPLLLFIWHKFLQPLFLKLWNPWGAVKAEAESDDEDEGTGADGKKKEKGPKVDGGLKCPFKPASSAANGSGSVTATGNTHPKID